MPSFGKKELGKRPGMLSFDEKGLGKRLGMNSIPFHNLIDVLEYMFVA